ncbi:MAG: alpha/beta hydrolase [Flaviaesturariibacter sp.]|nr:alpha/beta hydrolase [Flaviaesturariibacter sp.]
MQAGAQEFIPLWPAGKKPNSKGRAVTDSIANERIWRVGTPGIYAFPVPKSENKGTTVLICPGGGYERVSYIYNGFQFARWFNAHGINAFVLIYRLPQQPDLGNRQLAPLQDAQRAMRILRANRGRWGLRDGAIGVMGISAGGHVASMLGTHTTDESAVGDSVDAAAFRPDFMLLLSPVISMGEFAHPGSRRLFLGADTSAAMVQAYSTDKQVSAATPPTFLVHAQNDSSVNVRNSLLFFNALIRQNISASIHVFPQGGHGIALVDNPGSTDLWLDLLERWMLEQKFTQPLKKSP